jgi:gluconolactonase
MAGLTFSPDGAYAYVADTGAAQVCLRIPIMLIVGILGKQCHTTCDHVSISHPSPSRETDCRYRYTVQDDGTFEDRKLFAHVTPGFPDGVHCDAKGNVYAGCGDGVQVWNPSGKLIGKIYLGETSANFRESSFEARGFWTKWIVKEDALI